MTDLFDTGKIPNDEGYWDALAARVATEARQGGFARFASTPAAWAAALLLVTAAGLLVLAARGNDRGDFGREIAQALAPADYPAGSLVDDPAMGTLLFEAASRSTR